MVKNQEKLTNKTCLKQISVKKTPLVMVILIGFIFLLCVNFVMAFQFDNIQGDLIQNKDTSEYGKIEIRNSLFGWEWFQLGKVMSLELKTNTEQCPATGCIAKQEIIMYEDGKLIDNVRFLDLETGKETTIKSYEIYVNGDLYNGEEVSGYSNGVVYDVELRGKLFPRQKVDWQIKSAGTDWINEWAVWTESLETNLISWWNFDETTGTKAEDSQGTNDLYTNASWEAGLINNGLHFNTSYLAYNATFLDRNFTDISFSVWFNFSETFSVASAADYRLFTQHGEVWDNYYKVAFDSGSGNLVFGFQGEGAGDTSLLSNTTSWTAGTWYNIIIVWDGGNNVSLYVNGELNESAPYTGHLNNTVAEFDFGVGWDFNTAIGFNGTIDEFGIWNRTLNDTEIANLYNSGAGIAHEPPSGVTTTLISPVDNYESLNKIVTFSCNASISGWGISNYLNITNISLYHNETGTWEINQTNSTQKAGNSTSSFEVEFQDYEDIEWNCYACANNSDCNFGTNRTVNIKRLIVNSETYNNNTIEGSLETFTINVTTSSLYINTATLTYNNTEYSGSLIQDGYEYLISTSLNINGISSDANLTFNWAFLLEDSSTVYSASHEQSVLALTADDCSANTFNILNYTLRDEDNQSKLGGVAFNTIIELDVSIYSKGTTNEIISFSNTYTQINPAEVCLSVNLGNTEYSMDVSTIYSSDHRETEHHYLQSYSLTNETTHQNISLYDLNSSRSTTFLIVYKDTNFLPVENALINIQREYVGDGVFRSVEIGKTDSDGQTIGHFVKDDIVYTLIVSKGGQTLSTFPNIVAWCEDIVAENCQINLNQFDTGVPIEDWETYQNLDYTLDFNKDTRTVSLIFNTLDGSSAVITLNTTKSDRWMNDTVCSDIITSSSGTLSCVIGASYGNVSVISRVYMNEELITQANFKIFPDRDDYFGGTGVIFLLILVIILPLMFVTNTIGVVLGSIFGIIIAGALMIYTDFSWLGVRSSIIWIIIAGIILIWKIHERSKT